VLPLALTLTDFCYPTRSTIAQLSVYIEAPRCKKIFSLESISLLQETASALDHEVDLCWPRLRRTCFQLIDLMSPFMKRLRGQRDSHLDVRARVITAVLHLLLVLAEPHLRAQSQDAITSILKHVDRIVLRTQDISKVVPSMKYFIDLLEYYVGLDNTVDFEEEKAWLVQLMGHCCSDDEHLCADLLKYKEGSILISLSRMLMDDSKTAWKEVVALRQRPDHDPRQVHPILMMQRGALFALSCLMQPQHVADLVMRAIDCKLERRVIATLDRETVEEYFAGQEARKTYTLSFVLVMRSGQCRNSKVPDFQPIVLGGNTNLPSIYVNLLDFRLWIQICTVSGKYETFVCQKSLEELPQGQIVVTIVVNGSSIQAYLNEQAQLPVSRKLGDDPKILQDGQILSGKVQQLVPKPGQPVFDGVLTLLRASQHPAAPHEVESSIKASQKEAKQILTRRKERLNDQGFPDSVYNVTEVASALLQYIRLQFHDDPETRREKRRIGELDLIDPTTTMWMISNSGVCSQLLPQSHPRYVGLLKTPLQRAIFLAALVADNFEKTEAHDVQLGFPPEFGPHDRSRPKPPDHSVLVAVAAFLSQLLQSPRGRMVMAEDSSAMLVVRLIPMCGVRLDLSGYVQKSFRNLTSKMCALMLQAKQDAPTTSLVLDALFKKSMSDEGLIYKEDLQNLLLSQALTALRDIMHACISTRTHRQSQIHQLHLDIQMQIDLIRTQEQMQGHDEAILAPHKQQVERLNADLSKLQSEVQDQENLFIHCQKLQRQFFLQLHHIMDEIIHGLPLRPLDLCLLTQMVNTALETPYVGFHRGSDLHAQKMLETELAEGMPWEVWLKFEFPGASHLQASVSKQFPFRSRMRGPSSKVLLNVMEEANLRDERSILSPKLRNGSSSGGDHVFVHVVGSEEKLQADVEVRILPEFDPPLRLPQEHVSFEGRIIEFASAVLKKDDLPADAYANVCLLLASQRNDMRANSCIPHLASILMTCCRELWVGRLVCAELLQGVLYPEKHLSPILYLAGTAASTPLDTRLYVLQVCSQVIHPAMTPEEGFLQFLDNVYRHRIELPRPADDELPRPSFGEEHKKACSVTCLMSALHKQLPRVFQVALFNLAEAILARDAGECSDLINENQWADGAVVFQELNPGKFAFWRELHWFLMFGHPEVQDAAVRVLLILFWQQSVQLVTLICRTDDSGDSQLSGNYWLLVPLLRLLGHNNDEVVADLLKLFAPLARSYSSGDHEEEDIHDLDEANEDRLIRLARSVVSEASRSEILKEAMVQVSPRFIVRAMDWPCDVRDFVLDVVLTRSVMQELTVSPELASEFWDVMIHLLRECGLAGQSWVSTTLKELARISERVVSQSSGEDLRMVRSVCSPKVIAPLVSHIAAGTVLSDSDVAKEMSHALAEVPDSLLSLLILLPEKEHRSQLQAQGCVR
ncbi:RYR1, partial [Symbiodinium necroappetens]